MSFGYWIKMHHNLLEDYRLWMLSDAAKWRYVACSLMAGELGEGGFLPPMVAMLFKLRPLSQSELEADLRAMATSGLAELRVHQDGSERWFLTEFAERQAAVPAAERMKQSRKRQRYDTVTKRNTEVEVDKEADKEADKKQKQKKDALPRVAAAAAPAIAPESNGIQADPDDNPTALVLRTHGIALNQTTARLLDEPAEFVEGHLLAAQRRGETTGLAIRRIIDGDPVPRKPGEPVTQSIPAEWADVIKR